jgi:hypothetical protein
MFDVMDSLNIKINFAGSFKSFLEKIQKNGICGLEFNTDINFRKSFFVEKSTYSFNLRTHFEFDEFISKIAHIDSYNFKMNPKFTFDYFLLRSFDRIYWMRHFKNDKNPIYKSMTDREFECPFKVFFYFVFFYFVFLFCFFILFFFIFRTHLKMVLFSLVIFIKLGFM